MRAPSSPPPMPLPPTLLAAGAPPAQVCCLQYSGSLGLWMCIISALCSVSQFYQCHLLGLCPACHCSQHAFIFLSHPHEAQSGSFADVMTLCLAAEREIFWIHELGTQHPLGYYFTGGSGGHYVMLLLPAATPNGSRHA